MKKKIKVGDWVMATINCGTTKKGKVYQVILDKKNGLGMPCRGKLAINPVDHNPNNHAACTQIETWKLQNKVVSPKDGEREGGK